MKILCRIITKFKCHYIQAKCVKVALISSIMVVNSADVMSLSWTKILLNTVSSGESIPDPTNNVWNYINKN